MQRMSVPAYFGPLFLSVCVAAAILVPMASLLQPATLPNLRFVIWAAFRLDMPKPPVVQLCSSDSYPGFVHLRCVGRRFD
jgi:hypothetical protein